MPVAELEDAPLRWASEHSRLGPVGGERPLEAVPALPPGQPRERCLDRHPVEHALDLRLVQHVCELALLVEHLRQVDDRAGHARDRNAVDHGVVVRMEHSRGVHGDARPRLYPARHRDLDPSARGAADHPGVPRGAVAEKRQRPAGQHRGELPPARTERLVAHRVDAAMKAMQAPGPERAVDRVLGQPAPRAGAPRPGRTAAPQARRERDPHRVVPETRHMRENKGPHSQGDPRRFTSVCHV